MRLIDEAQSLEHAIASGRRACVHVARGVVHANSERLVAGDAAILEPELDGVQRAEVLVFHLA